MELVHECTFHADLSEPLVAGNGPAGTRMVIPVTGGWIKGDRLNGQVVGPGGDWALLGDDGFARLDVRGQLRTDDDAIVYVSYTGLLELNEATQAGLAGGSTDYGDHYFRTTPRFETGDDRYRWVNNAVFVGRGRLVPGAVEYEIYRVT
jgi:hypothetical protein